MAKKAETTQLPIRREMFLQYFVKNTEFRGNATLCYGLAYHYKLDELPDDDAVFIDVDDGKGGTYEKQISPSTRRKAENVCGVNSHKLLRMAKIQKRKTELLNEMLNDEVVDGELAKVILQDRELPAKNTAIKTYMDIKGRVVSKHEVTGKNGGPLQITSERAKSKAASILGL